MAASATPTITNCQSRLKASSPLISVAISVAWGAGYLSEPMRWASPWSRIRTVSPTTIEAVTTPMSSPICWARGVAPTRKPVLRSCEVAPALAAAMQTIAPTQSAIGW